MATFRLGSYIDPIKTLEFWRDNLECWEHLRDAGATTEYLARCPAHPDVHPSLVVLHEPSNTTHPVRGFCRAGCAFEDIVHLLRERAEQQTTVDEDMEMTPPITPSFYTPPQASVIETLHHSPIAQLALYSGVSYGWLKDTPDLPLAEDITTSYVYYVLDGAEGERPGPVLKARKMPPSEGDKAHEEYWINARKPIAPFWPIPPKELPEEFVTTEGETDCLLMRFWGFNAYALTAGAKTPLDASIARELYARGVRHWLICADRDVAGQSCCDSIVRLCLDAGITVTPIDLGMLCDPLVGGKKDVRDLRHTFTSPEEAHKAIREVIRKSEAQLDILFPPFDAVPTPPEVDDLVQDMIFKNCISLLVSKPGMGKTTVLMAYAAAARDGGKLLSKKVSPHRILLVTEEGMRSLDKKKKIYGSLPNCFVHSTDLGDFPSENWADRVRIIENVARRHNIDSIIIDTMWSFAICMDEDKSTAVRPMFRQLRYLTRQGYAVTVTVHGRKAQGTGLDVISGSVTIPGEVDVAVELTSASDGEPKHREFRWLKNRMNPDLVGQESFTITTEEDRLVVIDGAPTAQDREKKILEFLADDQWHTANDIASFLAITQDELRRPLENLCQQRQVLKEKCDGTAGMGRRGTYRYRYEKPLDFSGLKVR